MRRTIVYLAVAVALGIFFTGAHYGGALSFWVVVACVVGLGVIVSVLTRGRLTLNPVAVVAMLALAVTGVMLVAYMLQAVGPLGTFGLTAALGLAILVLTPFDRKRVRDQRELAGRCTECGYDLRESRERCPECGASIPVELARRRRIAILRASEKQAADRRETYAQALRAPEAHPPQPDAPKSGSQPESADH